MITSPAVLGLLGIMAVGAIIVLLKGHVDSLRKGDPFIIKGGVIVQRGNPAYRRLVAISFVSYAVGLALAFTLIVAAAARLQGLA